MNTQIHDTIIIGSGISGMAAGIILAKEGERVLVLEQHGLPGGLTQTYSRSGCVFPTGVHRIGSLQPGQPLWYYFKYLGLLEKLDLEPLNDDCFEHVFFPSQDYRIPIGREQYRERLIEYFPENRKGIDQYFRDFETAISNISRYNPGIEPKKDRILEYSRPLKGYLESINISDPLKSLITANSPLYGLSSEECPLITHFVISDSYLNSSFRINEQKTPFSRALVENLQALGGEIRVNARVSRILIKDKTAKGVMLENGEMIQCHKVVFSGHPGLLLDLCPPELFRPVFRKRLNQENTPGLFGVALKWKRADCPLRKNDAYIYDSWNVDHQYKRNRILEDDDLGMVYLSALPNNRTSCKPDPNIAVTALTGISEKETYKLKAVYTSSKKKIYQEMKDNVTRKIMAHIASVYPDIYDQAVVADCYSSVTFQRHTLTRDGSAYGIKKTAQRFLEGMFSPATKIRNLFLTGQSIGFNGIHGAIVSSVTLCQMLMSNHYIMKKIINVER